MMKRIFLLAVAFCAHLESRAAVKVAIVPDAASVEAADLLAAELGKATNIVLLERADLERIMREQSLANSASSAGVRAGALLGANAMIFLESGGSAENRSVTARLASVQQGAIFHAVRSPWSKNWTQNALNELAPLLPKTLLPPGRAVKLSVLNLRSPASVAASEALDRELTALLLLRLAREPEILALERRKLADLASEKELSDNSARFWTGSHLLDGTVNREGLSPDRVTIAARLQLAGGEVDTVEIAGVRSDLPGLIDRLVAGLLAKLKLSARGIWEPEIEAAHYLDEAQWALRWKMYDEAQSAADSAWALGLRSPESAAARTLAYARPATLDGFWSYAYTEGRPDITAKQTVPPRPAQAEPLRVALAVAEFVLANHREWLANDQWRAAVGETLKLSGELQAAYLWAPQSRPPAPLLAETRELSAIVANRAMENPVARDMMWFGTNLPPLPKLKAFFAETNVFAASLEYLPLFSKAPEATLQFYRKMIDADGFPFVRASIAGRQPHLPILGGWTAAERTRGDQLYARFAEELIASTNARAQVEGHFLKLYRANKRKDHEALDENLRRATNANPAIFKAYRISPLLRESFQEVQRRDFYSEAKSYSAGPFDSKIEIVWSRIDYLAGLEAARVENEWLTPRWQATVDGKIPFDAAFVARYADSIKERQRAAEIYLQLTNLVAGAAHLSESDRAALDQRIRLVNAIKNRPLPQDAMARELAYREERRARAATNLARAATNLARPAAPPPPANGFVIQIASNEYTRLFPPGKFRGESETPVYREERLWYLLNEEIELRSYDKVGNQTSFGIGEKISFAAIDPVSGKAEVLPPPPIKTDGMEDSLKNRMRFAGRPGQSRRFDLLGGVLYFSHQGELHQLHVASGRWTKTALPSVDADIHRVGDRLFLSGADSIYEMTGKDFAQSRLLASVRRKPAVTILDELPDLGRPALFAGANGRLRALARKNVYEFDGANWTALTSFPTNVAAMENNGAGIFRTHAELYLLRPADSSPQILASKAPHLTGLKPSPEKRIPAKFALSDWYAGHADFSLGAGMGSFTGAGRPGGNSTLEVYDLARDKILHLPVNFHQMLPYEPGRGGNFLVDNSRLWFLETPSALLLGLRNHPGFWTVPRAALDRAIAEATTAGPP